MFEGFTISDVKEIFGFTNNNIALEKDYLSIVRGKRFLGIKDLQQVKDVDAFYTKAFSYCNDNKKRAYILKLQGDLSRNYGYFLHEDSVITFNGLMTMFWYIDICMKELVKVVKQHSKVIIYDEEDEYYFETCLALYANQLLLSQPISIDNDLYYSVMQSLALNFYGALALQYSRVFKEEGNILFPVARKMLNSNLVDDLVYNSEDIMPDTRNIKYANLCSVGRVNARNLQCCFV